MREYKVDFVMNTKENKRYIGHEFPFLLIKINILITTHQ